MKSKKIMIMALSFIVVCLLIGLVVFAGSDKDKTVTVVDTDKQTSATDTGETPVTNADGSSSTFVPDKREEENDDEIYFAYTKGEDDKKDDIPDNSHLTEENNEGNNVDEKSGIVLDPNELEILNY